MYDHFCQQLKRFARMHETFVKELNSQNTIHSAVVLFDALVNIQYVIYLLLFPITLVALICWLKKRLLYVLKCFS